MEEQNQENKKKYRLRQDIKKTSFFKDINKLGASVLIGMFILLYLITMANVAPKKYSVQIGLVASETIEATKDIVDTYTTQANKKAARDAISTKYTLDDTVQPGFDQNTNAFFAGLNGLKAKEYELITARAQQNGTSVPAINEVNLVSSLTDADYETIKTVSGIELTKTEIKNALGINYTDLEKLRDYVKERVGQAYTAGIKQGAISDEILDILADIKTSYKTLYNKMPTAIEGYLTSYFKPNIVEDVEATEQAKQEAEDAVNPVTFQKGQTIVRKGDIVTQAQYSVINSLGLINSSSIDLSLYGGVALYIFLLLTLLAYYIYTYEKNLLQKRSNIVLMGLIICFSVFVTLILSKVDSRLNIAYYAALLSAVVFNVRVGAVVNIFMALMVTMVAKGDSGSQSVQAVYIAIASLMGGMAGLMYCKKSNRTNYLSSGLIAGGFSALTIAAILGITNDDMTTLFTTSGYMIVNAFLSAILLIGSLPIYESLFNILTDSKLLELSDPKNPLLKRLAIEAPGTYHHSMLVANLAENAAETIGANGLLARVGAYYHDIGKLRRPMYFGENQQGENPHDELPAKISASIILTHPKDGVRIASQYKLPREICDIIGQHHGTTLTAYFYDKALDEEEVVDINDYKYDVGKPVSAEAAIVMLADTVEAAVRAMPSRNDEAMMNKISKLVDQKMKEGQLDESSLSFAQLSKIKEAFFASYNGASHKRIEYPKIEWSDEDKQ